MWKKIGKIILMVIGGVVLAICMAFLFGWIVMLLWNWLMPPIFGLVTITFWQAWGLVILSHILFKAGKNHHPGMDHHGPPFGPHKWKKKFREKMKDHFREEPETPAVSES